MESRVNHLNKLLKMKNVLTRIFGFNLKGEHAQCEKHDLEPFMAIYGKQNILLKKEFPFPLEC